MKKVLAFMIKWFGYFGTPLSIDEVPPVQT